MKPRLQISHNLLAQDFASDWYRHWADKLKQTPRGRGKFALKANKFWQNAIMAQILYERGALASGKHGVGFGVGKERLPALFASMGVEVTATDQDFTKKAAKQWDNDQLAHGIFSLNEDGICDPGLFKRNVSFQPADMLKIPKSLQQQYDFVWSNCALGHLGSIENGLKFISDSSLCLKPGGWATHTTELNLLSDKETVTEGNTVIFRLRDILEISERLTQQGYICLPFRLKADRDDWGNRVSLRPEWGNDFSKLAINGHLLTQIVLIVHKPRKTLSSARRKLELSKHRHAYKQNLRVQKQLPFKSEPLRSLVVSSQAPVQEISIRPVRQAIRLNNKSQEVVIEYQNTSDIALTGAHESLYNTKPFVLGTDNPVNRESSLYATSWSSSNRPSLVLSKKHGGKWIPADYVAPGERFGFVFSVSKVKFSANKTLDESFTIIREGEGVVPNTQVHLKVTN